MLCNIGQAKEEITAYLCGILNPVQRSATPDHALVKRLGQRFESACWLSAVLLPKTNSRNGEGSRPITRGFLIRFDTTEEAEAPVAVTRTLASPRRRLWITVRKLAKEDG